MPKAKNRKGTDGMCQQCIGGILTWRSCRLPEAAPFVLLQREAKDNEIAAQKGLKSTRWLNVEFNDGADETGGAIGRSTM